MLTLFKIRTKNSGHRKPKDRHNWELRPSISSLGLCLSVFSFCHWDYFGWWLFKFCWIQLLWLDKASWRDDSAKLFSVQFWSPPLLFLPSLYLSLCPSLGESEKSKSSPREANCVPTYYSLWFLSWELKVQQDRAECATLQNLQAGDSSKFMLWDSWPLGGPMSFHV